MDKVIGGNMKMRHQVVLFMDVGTSEAPAYTRMQGFTELSKSKNPERYDRRYVDEAYQRSDVIGYAEEISYAFDNYVPSEVQQKIVDIVDGEKLGSDTMVSLLTVDFAATPEAGKYPARQRDYTVVPDSEGGDENAYTYSGTFVAAGDIVKGTAVYDASTKVATFTADAAAGE